MANLKILVVDDHNIVRDGVKSLIEDEPGYEIVGEAANGKEAVELCNNNKVDVVIMDITMPEMDGIEATEIIKKSHPDTKILALTMLIEDQHIRKMIKAGASGYILKSSGKHELLEAIDAINNDKHYFSEGATHAILQEMVNPVVKKSNSSQVANLTDREIEVLKYIVDEYTNQEIADKLFISVRTVDAHRRNLLQKTGAKNTAGLVKHALKNKLL
ncbi:MAG: response regulator transcription factor [Balneolaceae bacterium]